MWIIALFTWLHSYLLILSDSSPYLKSTFGVQKQFHLDGIVGGIIVPRRTIRNTDKNIIYNRYVAVKCNYTLVKYIINQDIFALAYYSKYTWFYDILRNLEPMEYTFWSPLEISFAHKWLVPLSIVIWHRVHLNLSHVIYRFNHKEVTR